MLLLMLLLASKLLTSSLPLSPNRASRISETESKSNLLFREGRSVTLKKFLLGNCNFSVQVVISPIQYICNIWKYPCTMYNLYMGSFTNPVSSGHQGEKQSQALCLATLFRTSNIYSELAAVSPSKYIKSKIQKRPERRYLRSADHCLALDTSPHLSKISLVAWSDPSLAESSRPARPSVSFAPFTHSLRSRQVLRNFYLS